MEPQITDIDKFMANQDRLQAMMKEAYHNHTLPFWFVFTPYFQWKEGKRGCDFKHIELVEMRNVAERCIEIFDKKHPTAFDDLESFDRNSIFYPYNGYEGDAASVVFLSLIDDELTNLIILTSMG